MMVPLPSNVAFELRDEKTTVLFVSEQYNALPECSHISPVLGHFAKLRLPSLHKAFLVCQFTS